MKNTMNSVLAELRVILTAVHGVAVELAHLQNPVLVAQIAAVIVALVIPLGLNVDAKAIIGALTLLGAIAATVVKYTELNAEPEPTPAPPAPPVAS